MDGMICLLILGVSGGQLLKVAVKTENNDLPLDLVNHWREPENFLVVEGLVPAHCSDGFQVVGVEEIFEVVVAE